MARALAISLLDVGGFERWPFHLDLAGNDVHEELQGFIQELGAVEEPIRQPHFEGFGAVDHAVLVERIGDDQFQDLFQTQQLGSQGAAAPARDQPQKTFGETDGRNAAGHRAVLAVESDFQTAAQGHAIDGRQRRERQVP